MQQHRYQSYEHPCACSSSPQWRVSIVFAHFAPVALTVPEYPTRPKLETLHPKSYPLNDLMLKPDSRIRQSQRRARPSEDPDGKPEKHMKHARWTCRKKLPGIWPLVPGISDPYVPGFERRKTVFPTCVRHGRPSPGKPGRRADRMVMSRSSGLGFRVSGFGFRV